MKLLALIDGLKNKTISVLTSEHRSWPILERLELEYEHITKMIAEHSSGDKDIDHQMLRYYNDKLNGIIFGNDVGYFDIGFGLSCGNCEEELYVVIISEYTVALVPKLPYLNTINNKKHFSVNDIKECEATYLVKQQKIITHIQVNTGKLVFANFFRNEEIYGLPEKIKWSKPGVNSLLGRDRLAQHLATKNVGYGQMSNMSVTIFAKNDGTKIIVGSEYTYTNDNEKVIRHKGYTKLGTIHLEVWRWMCADQSVLEQYCEELNSPKWRHLSKPIIANVKTGKWLIEHYYDFQTNKDTIYSTLTLET